MYFFKIIIFGFTFKAAELNIEMEYLNLKGLFCLKWDFSLQEWDGWEKNGICVPKGEFSMKFVCFIQWNLWGFIKLNLYFRELWSLFLWELQLSPSTSGIFWNSSWDLMCLGFLGVSRWRTEYWDFSSLLNVNI